MNPSARTAGPPPHHRRAGARTAVAGLAAVLLALVPLALGGLPAHAAGEGGWVRLTHLSPDTPEVDVSLTSLSDSSSVLELEEVGYGAVSDYTRVDPGTYVATMTPAGGGPDSEPAISQSVTVEDGRAYTVAAVGLNADLEGTVLQDDLEAPADGRAEIRLLQASVSAPSVTVTAVGGPTLAEDAAFGTATGYAEVDSGVWSVTVTPTEGEAAPVTTEVRAESASVSTVVVLDAADGGGLETLVVPDAAGVAEAPAEGTGVETGLGGTAVGAPRAGLGTVAVVGALLLGGLGALVLLPRSAARPRRALTGSGAWTVSTAPRRSARR